MILGISTSLSHFCVILSNNNCLIYHNQVGRELNGQSNLYELVSQALKVVNITISAITNIIVDIGPGGTSSVRTGVSFANGLSYSLNIPITGVSSAELIGIDAYKIYEQPVAILFKSIKNNYYCGLYNGNHLYFKYLDLHGISKYICDKYPNIVLTGNYEGMTELKCQLVGVNVIMSQIHKVSPYVLGENSAMFVTSSNKYPILTSPITETNLI